ncbi:MAG: ATP-binding protein [Candidatus Symbiothrix sp.]|jgi:predicted AAA+ superfamily ATPase|nr:ATP-binding protein [Candidatus Symbiothrix sp.]
MKSSIIKTVAEEQREFLLTSDSGFQRKELCALPDLSSYVLIISGIRRCGKSTLLKQFLKSKHKDAFFFNFEDIRLYDFSIDDFPILDKFINNSGEKVLFFDEIQIVKGWELFVRQKLEQGFQVVLSGSNANLLSRELGTKLTGRHITRELYPFSYSEFCSYKNLAADKQSVLEYLGTGGFPEVVKSDNNEILQFLIEDILNRDIAVRYGIRNVSLLKRLCSFLLSNAGNLLSPNKLKNAIGIKSASTILDYFSYFESCYLLNLMPKFAFSAKAQMLAPKKLYINDTGLIKIGSTAFSENSGHLLENVVFYHLLRKSKELFYFNENGKECDFALLKNGKCKELVQTCWELNTDNENREIGGLFEAMHYFKLDTGTIVTFDANDLIKKDGKTINVVAASEFLE